jgi:DNA-binding transcriptional MerR regulator
VTDLDHVAPVVTVVQQRSTTLRAGHRATTPSVRATSPAPCKLAYAPARRVSGYREYSEADMHAVRDIRTLLAAGLGTATIAEVLPCMVKDGGQLTTPCGDLVALLARERDRIDSAVRALMSARGILDAIIVASGSGGFATAAACEECEATDNSRLVASPKA